MPPFVDHIEAPAMPSQSASSELLSRSKSADGLLDLKRMALQVGGDKEGVRSQSTGASNSNSNGGGSSRQPLAPPTSMEWVGSYFFSHRNNDNNPYSEEDLVVLHTSGDGDDSTVGAHFAESDFLTSNWTGAVEYIPPVGFAVVAGGLCLMNPIVFIGGILTACTALGAVHAAQTSYDTCIEGNLCQIFEKVDKEEEEQRRAAEALVLNNSPEPLKREVSDVTFNMAGMEDAVSEVDPERMLGEQALLVESTSESLLPQDPSMLETSEQALEWVNQYYPPLSCMNVEKLEFSGLNALEFFDVFLADDAPFTFSEFQRKRQDKNIRYGNWEDLSGVTQPSLVQAAATIAAARDEDEMPITYHDHLKERVLHFQAKTNSGLFGPPYATTTKVQRCLVPNKRLLVLESKTTLKDIPFCDRFYVLERWLVTSEKRKDQYVSTMTVTCQVVFSKSCSFESTIVSKSQDTVTDIASQWNVMAQTALQLTEQARRERLEQDNAQKKAKAHVSVAPVVQTTSNTTASTDVKKETTLTTNDSIEVEQETSSRIIGHSDEEENIPAVVDGEEGKPPKIPNPAKSSSRRRQSSMRKSLGRSLSNIMRRRNSNPI